MDPTLIAGALGVAGTLLGALTAGLLAHRAARATHLAGERAALRRDQVDAVARLAAAAGEHRRTSYARRRLEQIRDDRIAQAQTPAEVQQIARDAEPELAAAREDAYRTRAAIGDPLARVRLLLPHPTVLTAADQLLDTTYALRHATDLEAARQASLAAHDHLLAVAGTAIRTSTT